MSKCVLIGCGTMGSIFLEAVLRVMPTHTVTVLEHTAERAQKIKEQYGVTAITPETYDCAGVDLVILGMKPQDSSTLPHVLGQSARGSLILSMMAGIDLASLRALTGASRVVRCMPNTPAKIGQGMTVWTATEAVTTPERALIEKILTSFGAVLAVPADDWIDKATAVSGSGPAYVFAFAEACLAGAQQLGFSAAEATQLVQQTITGAVALWQNSTLSASELRQQVTSKGGTTAAALNVLTDKELNTMLTAAMQAAYERAQALNQNNKK